MARLAVIALVLLILTPLPWFAANRPMAGDVTMPAARLHSVSFAPFRPGQSPFTGRFPSEAQVDADLALVATRADGVRTYAANEGDYDTAALAARHGLTVWQGIWLGGDLAGNARELGRGITLARTHPGTITRVVVGNEVLLRRDLPVEALIADIDQVRAAVSQPVTYADVWEFWLKFPQLAEHVDVITVHLLPYWEDNPTNIAGAVAHVRDIYRQMVARFPGKKIVIGETGWPSRGRWRRDAAPGRVEQAMFLRRFIALSEAEGFEYNLIEAFDQGWKYINEGVVGANWGIWSQNRGEKFPLSGALEEDPDWRAVAAAQGVLFLLLLGLANPARRRAEPGVTALLAWGLAGALAFAGWAQLPVLYDEFAYGAALVNLPAQAVLAVVAMRVARLDRARDGAAASSWLQAVLRGDWQGWSAMSVLSDLAFWFLWTAAVLQLLLVVDARYRDVPTPALAVSIVVALWRCWLGGAPRGLAELVLGAVVTFGAVVVVAQEGVGNWPFSLWALLSVVLVAPSLLGPARPRRREPGPACPSSHSS